MEEQTTNFFNKFYGSQKRNNQINPKKTDRLSVFFDDYFFKVKKLLPAEIKSTKNTKILDLGCGDGNYLFFLIENKKIGN